MVKSLRVLILVPTLILGACVIGDMFVRAQSEPGGGGGGGPPGWPPCPDTNTICYDPGCPVVNGMPTCCGHPSCCGLPTLASLEAQIQVLQNDEATQTGIVVAASSHITQLSIEIGQWQVQVSNLTAQRDQNNALIGQLQAAKELGEIIHDLTALKEIANASGWGGLVVTVVAELGEAGVNALLGAGLDAFCVNLGEMVAQEQSDIDVLNGKIYGDNEALGVWVGIRDAAQAAVDNDIAQIVPLQTKLAAVEACGW